MLSPRLKDILDRALGQNQYTIAPMYGGAVQVFGPDDEPIGYVDEFGPEQINISGLRVEAQTNVQTGVTQSAETRAVQAVRTMADARVDPYDALVGFLGGVDKEEDDTRWNEPRGAPQVTRSWERTQTQAWRAWEMGSQRIAGLTDPSGEYALGAFGTRVLGSQSFRGGVPGGSIRPIERSFPLDAITEGHLGFPADEGGGIRTDVGAKTFKRLKLQRREALLPAPPDAPRELPNLPGKWPTVGLRGPMGSGELQWGHTASLRAPGVGAERGIPVYAATSLRKEIGPPGQNWADPGTLPQMARVRPFYFPLRDRQLTAMSIPGINLGGYGEKAEIARTEAGPLTTRVGWGAQSRISWMKEVTNLGSGKRALMGELEELRDVGSWTEMKFLNKGLVTQRRGLAQEYGVPGLQMVTARWKSRRQGAAAVFGALTDTELRDVMQKYGGPEWRQGQQLVWGTEQDIPIMRAFEGYVQANTKMLRHQAEVAGSMLPALQERIVGKPQEIGPGMYNVTLEDPFFVGKQLMQFQPHYPGRARIRTEELGYMMDMGPEMAERAQRQIEGSTYQRERYTELMNVYLSQTRRGREMGVRPARQATELSKLDWAGIQKIAGASPTEEGLLSAMSEVAGRTPIKMPWGTTWASPLSMWQHRAYDRTGEMQGMTSYYAREMLHQVKGRFQAERSSSPYARAYEEEMIRQVRGPGFRKEMMSAQLDRGGIQGGIHGSMALQAHEMWVSREALTKLTGIDDPEKLATLEQDIERRAMSFRELQAQGLGTADIAPEDMPLTAHAWRRPVSQPYAQMGTMLTLRAGEHFSDRAGLGGAYMAVSPVLQGTQWGDFDKDDLIAEFLANRLKVEKGQVQYTPGPGGLPSTEAGVVRKMAESLASRGGTAKPDSMAYADMLEYIWNTAPQGAELADLKEAMGGGTGMNALQEALQWTGGWKDPATGKPLAMTREALWRSALESAEGKQMMGEVYQAWGRQGRHAAGRLQGEGFRMWSGIFGGTYQPALDLKPGDIPQAIRTMMEIQGTYSMKGGSYLPRLTAGKWSRDPETGNPMAEWQQLPFIGLPQEMARLHFEATRGEGSTWTTEQAAWRLGENRQQRQQIQQWLEQKGMTGAEFGKRYMGLFGDDPRPGYEAALMGGSPAMTSLRQTLYRRGLKYEGDETRYGFPFKLSEEERAAAMEGQDVADYMRLVGKGGMSPHETAAQIAKSNRPELKAVAAAVTGNRPAWLGDKMASIINDLRIETERSAGLPASPDLANVIQRGPTMGLADVPADTSAMEGAASTIKPLGASSATMPLNMAYPVKDTPPHLTAAGEVGVQEGAPSMLPRDRLVSSVGGVELSPGEFDQVAALYDEIQVAAEKGDDVLVSRLMDDVKAVLSQGSPVTNVGPAQRPAPASPAVSVKTTRKFSDPDQPDFTPRWGEPGYRIAAGYDQDEFVKRGGGWKLHLTAAKENYAAIDEWLGTQQDAALSYKLLKGGDPQEKDFTAYVGSFDKARQLSSRIDSEIGHLLLPSNAGSEDVLLSERVAARFDVQNARGKGRDWPRAYGYGGVPFDPRGVETRTDLLFGKELRTEKGRQALAAEAQRVHGRLVSEYGEYYTGSYDPFSPAGSAEMTPPQVSLAQQAIQSVGGMPALQREAQRIAAFKQQHGRSTPPPNTRFRQALNTMMQTGQATQADIDEYKAAIASTGVGLQIGSSGAPSHIYTGLAGGGSRTQATSRTTTSKTARQTTPPTAPSGTTPPPPSGPPPDVVGAPPDWWDEDPGIPGSPPSGSGQPASGGGMVDSQGRRRAEPWETGAWMSKAEATQLQEAAQQFDKWGKVMAQAINSTGEVNRAQQSFVKTLERTERAYVKGQKTVEQLDERMKAYPDAPQEWRKLVGDNFTRAQAAVQGLRDNEGFRAMQAAVARQDMQAQRMGLVQALAPRGRPVSDEARDFLNAQVPGWQRMVSDEEGGWLQRVAGQMQASPLGRISRGLDRFTSGWELMRLQRMWNLTGAPVFNQFIPAAAQSQMAAWQAAQTMGGAPALPGGVAGGVAEFQAAQQQALIDAGVTGYQAWGWTQQATGAWNQARAIFGPAAGAGLIAGGLATTGLATLGGLSFGAASAAALPITAAVGAGAGAIGLGAYATNMASPTVENQLAAYYSMQHPVAGIVPWEATMAGLGSTIRGYGQAAWQSIQQGSWVPLGLEALKRGQRGLGPQAAAESVIDVQYGAEMAAAGAQIAGTPFGQLDISQRAAALSYLGKELRSQGGEWGRFTGDQIAQIAAVAGPWTNLENLDTETIMRAGGTEVMRSVARRGYGPERFQELASTMYGGLSTAFKLYDATEGMGEVELSRFMSTLERYSPLVQYGYDAGDLIEGVQSGALYRRTGQDLVGLQRSLAAMPQITQAFGVTSQSAFAQDTLKQMLGLGPYVEQIEAMGRVAPIAGAVSQTTGMDPMKALMRFTGMQMSGVAPAGMSIVYQAMQGQGAYMQALGAPGGLAGMTQFEQLVEQGEMTPLQYQQLTSGAALSRTQLGWNMMAGGYGIGNLMKQQAALTGRSAPTYAMRTMDYAQIPGSGGEWGLYGRDALAKREAAWDNLNAQQAYTMEKLNNSIVRLTESFEEFTEPMQELAQAQSDYQYGYQQSQLGMAAQGAAMSFRQSMERLQLQQAIFAENTAYQRQQMGMQYEQMTTRREWQLEDFAFGRQMAGMQYEYSMGELDRSIRFATGRQKQALLRQRAYQEEVYSMQEGRRGTEEDRAKTAYEWQEAAFALQKDHFETITALQQQQFEMQKRHLEERYSFEMAKIGAQMEHLKKMKEFEDERRKLQNEHAKKQYEYQLQDLERQRQYYQEVVFPYQRQQLQWQNDLEDAVAAYNAKQIEIYSPGGALYEAYKRLVNLINSANPPGNVTAGGNNGIELPEGTPPPPAPAKALGGPVSGGTPYYVGEAGPELFVPDQAGDIVPNYTIEDLLTGKAKVSVGNITIHVDGAGDPEAVAQAVYEKFEEEVNNLARRQRDRGGTW